MSWRGPGYGAWAVNPAVLIDAGLDRADAVEVHGMRGSPNAAPLGDVTSVLGGVMAEVKPLERDGDAGAVAATGRATVAAYPAEWVLRQRRLRAARPGTPFGHQPRKP
jgi:hypothetical protein